MRRLQPTRRLAFRLWWALAWRWGLSLGLILLAQGFLVGVLSALLGLSAGAAETLAGILAAAAGMPLALAASYEVLYRLLDRPLDGFELALLAPKEEASADEE